MRAVKYRLVVFEDIESQFRWRLNHVNGNTVATCGEGYQNFGDMMRVIRNLFFSSIVMDITRLEAHGSHMIILMERWMSRHWEGVGFVSVNEHTVE